MTLSENHPVARHLADFTLHLRLADVPSPVLERAKLHILDAIGLALASNAQDYASHCARGIAAMGGAGACSIIGRDLRMQPRDAAMLNAILVHGLDFDDTHLGSIIHPTTTALPCALALGEELDASGADVITAFLAGAEAGIRIGGAVNGGFHHVGFHATGVVSHFASALTAGKLLGNDSDQMVAAQGITGSTASGIQVFLEEGAWTKRFHPGWGAAAGITAAYLAQAGFKGPSRPYEGKFGLFDTHLDTDAQILKPEELREDLGKVWRFGDTALKPYPVCHFIHGCADAAIELHHQIGDANIVSVEALLAQPTLHIIAEPTAAKERPTTEYEAKFSAQFVTAYCLLYGRFGLPDLQPEALGDAKALALARKVSCKADPDTRFPEFYSGGVSVELDDGRVLSCHIPVNSGAGERAMTRTQVTDKFLASASLWIDDGRAKDILNAVLGLENITARDLMALVRNRR